MMRFCCSNFSSKTRKGRIDFYTNSNYAIAYCPWCGKDLGKRLNWEYYEILEKEYGIYDPETIEQDKVPEEFKNEGWWKKRGF